MKFLKIITSAVIGMLIITSVSCGIDESASENTQTPVDTGETEAAIDNNETAGEILNMDAEIPTVLQNQKYTLRFDENGEFRIVVFGDVQAQAPAPSDQTLAGIKTIIDREKPDLVLFSGDNSVGFANEKLLEKYLSALTGYIEERQIPWAHVFGNHDDEGGLSRERQQAVYESFEYCISQTGPDDVKGVGNYVLPVYSKDETRTDPVFAVWGLDSGGYVTDKGLPGNQAALNHTMYQGHPGTTYAYMPFSQVKWYYDTSEELEKYAGHIVPALAYFHIPLQEFYEIWLNSEQTGVIGVKQEPVCAGPLNSGMFTAMVERGDVKAVCCGHDHINDYSGEFCGIKLCYASNIGFDTYHDADIMGGRVFVVKESDPDNIETYISYLNGISLKEIKNSSEVVIDFEDSAIYTLENGEAVENAGKDGSAAVRINGDCTIQTGEPFKINNGRYLKLWLDASEGTLDSIAIINVSTNVSYMVKIADSEVYYCSDGDMEWQTSPNGENLPDNFKGSIAISAGALKNTANKTEIPSKDTAVGGFSVSSTGNVIIDNIQMVASYKK